MTAVPLPRPDAAEVLRKATLRAADRLGIQQKELAEIIGVSAATVSRMAAGRFALEPGDKAGELALLLVRVFRSLDALVGGNEAQVKAWFHAHNEHLEGVPAERVRTALGLCDVARYLDAMRGQF